MKKYLSLLLACLFLLCLTPCAFASGFEEGEQTSPVETDLDGDGVLETLAIVDILKEDGEARTGIEVSKGTERCTAETEIAGFRKLFLSDLDGDGLPEILFTGSEDIDAMVHSYCWRYTGGTLVPVPFEEGEVLAGLIAAVSPYELNILRIVDALGTYTGYMDMRFEDGKIVFDSDAWRIAGDDLTRTPVLTVKQDIYVLTSVGDEGEYGEEALLEEGTVIYLLETDAKTWISFMTETGESGVILLEEDENGFPTFVNGMPETEVFEGIEYAG